MALFIPERKEGESFPRELINMGSRNHSHLQGRIMSLFDQYEEFIAYTELSLDVSSAPFEEVKARPRQEMKPDVCLYPVTDLDLYDDEVRMTEMPLLAVEIVSPFQGLQEIAEKFRVYFAMGVQSCWLVIPLTRTVTVYHAPDAPNSPIDGMVYDKNVQIRLSLDDIFKRFGKRSRN